MALFGLGSEAPPESIPLTPIKTEEDLDAALQTAEEEGHALLIDWMATWCRKCIYLLPKMEKLSAEFHDVRFYMVNVNEVPGALVKRGGIQKMPTIQLWKNKERVGEVIGGHKAWMVMDEIRDMIKTDGVQGAGSS
ncbi:hypothetical protein KFL_004460040 [Klebsormidium nitens]|uniref:Thioredoxin domain-containing protein n=1 Tax=Klebsormidium nitens TaxID=105231 RepID=A0A1Y1ICI7_KLENI|nr:hypothetical protein KFL_004460040 [Klebsormidium nitens]|eukprot:GAQ88630.1 hypothetical protein KFL_004460040 [Klebsormidium nitens]